MYSELVLFLKTNFGLLGEIDIFSAGPCWLVFHFVQIQHDN
jgi:hypothetical protein